MPSERRIYHILVASPSDVEKESEIIHDVVRKWNAVHGPLAGLHLEDVSWRTHSQPEAGARPQALLNKQFVHNCDAVVAVFWTRLGTPTGVEKSGTVEEIKHFLSTGKPVMLYFSRKQIDPYVINDVQFKEVQAFKAEMRATALYRDYDGDGDFRNQLTSDIARLAEKWRVPSARSSEGVRSSVEKDALHLLKHLQRDGNVLRLRDHGHTSFVMIGTENYYQTGNPQFADSFVVACKWLHETGKLEEVGRDDVRAFMDGGNHGPAKVVRYRITQAGHMWLRDQPERA